MLKLGHNLQEGLSKLRFLGLQGYKGSDILAAIIIAESTELDVLDLFENRYSLVGTVIGKMKRNNRLTAINLSTVGGHYAEMGGLVYHPFDIHKMKPLIDKCRHLTDIILFGYKLTHEAITYFCENAPPTLLTLKDPGGIHPSVRRSPVIFHRIMLWSQKFLTLSINIPSISW